MLVVKIFVNNEEIDAIRAINTGKKMGDETIYRLINEEGTKIFHESAQPNGAIILAKLMLETEIKLRSK